ncbi:ribosome biogenesis GTPase Der [Candidatus Saccharibacteria bacterium]|nr:ribosome biogenesis GTPase Der [Candidatus Saccharibacteria bacterium]
MKTLPIVALIGQTNAGKSSLLNRFAHKNIAIVAREEGTTRDNVSARIDDRFLLVDTAGLKNPTDDFEASIKEQIDDAIESADLILLTLDSTKFFNHYDKNIARSALKSKKPVFLILNKSDHGEALDINEFRALGIDESHIFRTSATTGQGISELKHAILKETKNVESIAEDDEGIPALKIALIGRPNVGKSSLFNTLSKKQQAIVSSRQGTTRDVNRVEVKFKGKILEILDTAGLRKPGKREVGIEKFSALRTLAAIEEADICCLLVDSTEPHSKLDQSLAGQIVEAGKGIIVVVTKSDLLDNSTPTNYFGEQNIKNRTAADFLLDSLERDFDFLPYAPVIFTSSETGKNTTKIFDLALDIDEARHHQIKTQDLNKILHQAILEHTPAGLKNTHPKPKYIVQTDITPPWFVVHGHDLGLLHWSYKRFLERKIREFYPFLGTPIFFSFRNTESESIDKKNSPVIGNNSQSRQSNKNKVQSSKSEVKVQSSKSEVQRSKSRAQRSRQK